MSSAMRHTETSDLRRLLRRTRAGVRRTLLMTALLGIVAIVIAAAAALGLIDYALRLPAWIRWTHLTIGLGALASLVVRRVVPAWRFRPDLSTVALQIESRRPETRDRLASAVELERAATDLPGFSGRLASLAAKRARDLVPAGAGSGLIDRGPALKAGGAAAAAVVVVGLTALGAPRSVETALVRTFAPWVQAEWPKRTDIEDATLVDVHPRGDSAPLRAVLVRSASAPEQTDVSVRLRTIENGEVVDRQRLLASWQRREAASRDGAASGELFEALVESTGEALEYRFESTDDATPWRRIELVARPAVASASAEIRRPAYLSVTAPESEPDVIQVDLGRGTDERAAAPGSLEGSEVRATITLNKPVPTEPENPVWRRRVLGPAGAAAEMTVSGEGATWTLAFGLKETRRFEMNLVDEHGIESAETAVFRFPAVRDQPPSVVVLEPAHDMTALPQAVIDLSASARDDVGLAALWASAQRLEPEGESPSGRGGAMAPAGDELMLERAAVSAGELEAEVTTSAALADLGARPGDEVRLWATAVDVFAFESGEREAVRSAERRIFIVSEEEFVEQLRGSLTALRREAIRLFEEQQSARERAASGEASPTQTRREQASIARELERQVERARGVREQIEMNRLEDRTLDGLTADAEALTRSAAEAAQEAAEAAGEVSPERPESDASREARERVDRGQERTLDDLSDLISLLDSGEDAWSARRNLEQLIERQREALEATRELGRETAGLTPEELTPEEREELEGVAERQAELAERARAASQELRDAERALREDDPATSSALSQAARQLEQQNTAQTMQQAAEQAQENRTARAAGLQQQALEDLEQALERLDEAERSREEQLRRLARSLVETIRGLIQAQETELARLEAGEADLDRAMIALHARTVAAQQAALEERELRPVARPLEDAATAQMAAASALRRAPPDRDAASQREAESLAALGRALEEAERLQEQIEQEAVDRERRELEQAYRAALETQIELRDATRDAAPEGRVNRRARLELRRLSASQAELARTVDELYTQTQALSDAVVFEFAHRKLDAALDAAEARLNEADARAAIERQERAIAILRGLIEALEEDPNDDESEFDEGGGGGGGGGQGGGQPELIPGGAQLKLLRAIQQDVLDRTRAADDGKAEDAALESLAEEQRELSEIGQTLIDELTQQQQGPQPPGLPEGVKP